MMEHEKLIVYQKSLRFVEMRITTMAGLSRRVAACDHLERGAESIGLNISRAANSRSPKEKIVFLGNANGSALECAACFDVLVAKALLNDRDVHSCKLLLAEIVSMLIAMRRIVTDHVCEPGARYRIKNGGLFDHENLDVYRTALDFIRWLEPPLLAFSCSADLRAKLDQSTTAIVLNIAEGNGRFSGVDRARFLTIAARSAMHASSLLDLAFASGIPEGVDPEEGRTQLRRIMAMLTSLSKSVSPAA